MEESLFNKYRKEIKETFHVDDDAVDMLCFEAGRLQGLTILLRHPLLFHGLLAILTNLLYTMKGLKRNIKDNKDDDFIFVSCPDTIFRTKTINIIAENLNYSIIYLPNFHILTALRYHQFFRKQGIKAYFPTVKFRYVLRARKILHRFLNRIGGVDGNLDSQKMVAVLSSFAIYDQVVNNYLYQTKTFKGKWILEHDKFFFMASVINLHLKGKECTMLQHGIFFKPSFNYIPLYCDKVLCCSEREKQIYIENRVSEDRVVVFGAPLQTLQLDESSKTTGKHYEILVMLTIIKDDNIDIIRKVLNYIKLNYNSVLVRLRPRSRKKDEFLLADVLKGMTINKKESSIMEDLSNCNKVISFSEDANIEIAKMNKPFIYVWNGKGEKSAGMEKCATKDNFQDEINKLLAQKFYSTFSKEQYHEILGETNVDVLQNRFVEYIKQ